MSEKDYQRAKKRAVQLRRFYTTLITFVVINLVLFIINVITSPGYYWFWWVTVFWGIALIIYAFNVFTVQDKYLGDEWEERKAKEIMEKEKREKKEK